jgi:SH3-like domain-containing protein
LYGGNISAVVAEGLRRVREEEGREALVTWLGDAGHATESERTALRSEWRQEPVDVQLRPRTRK